MTAPLPALLQRIPLYPTLSRLVARHPEGTLVGMGLVTAGIKPILYDDAYKREDFSPAARRLLFTQECVRQFISTGLWLGSLIASWKLSKKMFTQTKDPVVHFVIANAGSLVMDTFVRPYMTAWITGRFFPERELQPSPIQKTLQTKPIFSAMPRQAPQVEMPARRPSYGYQPAPYLVQAYPGFYV